MSRRAQSVLAVLGAVVLAAHLFSFRAAAVDDAYVSYRYARNLARGAGLAYNAGERVEGYSNFLWTVLHAPIAARGGDPLPASRVLGLALLAVSLWLLWDLTRIHAPGVRGIGWVAVVLAVADPGTIYWHLAGLEPPLVGVLLLLALRWAGTRKAGIAWLALLLTRVDAIVPVAVAALFDARATPRRRAFLTWGVVAAGFLAYTLWRMQYFGDWLPNAARAKFTGSFAHLGTSLRDLIAMLPLCPALVAAPVLLAKSRGLPSQVRVALTIALVQVGYIVFAGGDWMPLHRLFAPFVPLVVFGVVVTSATRWTARGRRWSVPVAAAVLVVGLASYHLSDAPVAVALHAENVRVGRVMGEMLLRVREPDLVLATAAAGATPYFSDLRTVDTSGLTERRIARTPIAGRTPVLPVGHERGDGKHVLDRKPDLLVFTLGRSTLPGMYVSDAQMAFDPRLYAHYETFGFAHQAPVERRWFLYGRPEPLRKLAFIVDGRVVKEGFGAMVETNQALQLKVLRRTEVGSSRIRGAFLEISDLDPMRARQALEAHGATIAAAGMEGLLEPLRAVLALRAGDASVAREHATRATADSGPYADLFRLWLQMDPATQAVR